MWRGVWALQHNSEHAGRCKCTSVNRMEECTFNSAFRAYHIYKDDWKLSIGKKLHAEQEFNNPGDKNGETVSHFPVNMLVFSHMWQKDLR